MIKFKGDTGKFRKALFDAGFKNIAKDGPIFNDKGLCGGRRLKLWFAADVVYEDVAVQQEVYDNLKAEFGERLISVYSLPVGYWAHGARGREQLVPGYLYSRSLCVKLKE